MCTCTSCEFTDSFTSKGFAEWPKGPAKGARKSDAEYRAHVAYATRGGVSRAIPVSALDPDPLNFYGTPKGMTRAQIAAVLRETFATGEEG